MGNLFSSKKQCDCADLIQQAVAQLRNVNLNTSLLSQIVQLLSKSNDITAKLLSAETEIRDILVGLGPRPVGMNIVWGKPQVEKKET